VCNPYRNPHQRARPTRTSRSRATAMLIFAYGLDEGVAGGKEWFDRMARGIRRSMALRKGLRPVRCRAEATPLTSSRRFMTAKRQQCRGAAGSRMLRLALCMGGCASDCARGADVTIGRHSLARVQRRVDRQVCTARTSRCSSTSWRERQRHGQRGQHPADPVFRPAGRPAAH